MRKPIKYTLISLGSILALIVIAIGVLVNIIFTPSRLTPIVRSTVARFVTCPVEIGEVELTFFSTFPNFGLRLDNVCIVNPKEGAPNDTLLQVSQFDAIIDLPAFLRENKVDLSRLVLSDVMANIYVAADSTTNFDIFVTDASADDEPSSLELNEMNLQGIRLSNVSASYVDKCQQMQASLVGLNFELDGNNRLLELDGRLQGVMRSAAIHYADSLQCADLFGIAIPQYAIETHTLHDVVAQFQTTADSIRYQQLGQAPLSARLDGFVLPTLHAAITGDRLTLDLENGIESLTALHARDGKLANSLPLSMRAHVETDTLLSFIRLTDCELQVADEHINLTADVTRPDSITTTADVKCTMGATSFDRLLALVPATYRKPLAGMTVHGNLDNVSLQAQLSLVDTLMELNSFDVRTDLANLRYAQGKTMEAQLGSFAFAARYPVASQKMEQLKQQQQDKRQKNTKIRRRSEAVQEAKFMQATLDGKTFHVRMDDSAHIEATIPTMTFNGTFSDEILRDANSLPFIAADFVFDHLKASMDTIDVSSNNLFGSFVMADGVRGLKKYYEATFACNNIDARMGNELHAVTGPLDVEASSVYDSKQTDPLLMYNPVLNINMKEGNIRLAQIEHPIIIPSLDFDFNLGKFIIRDGQIHLGESDFQVTGDVLNIQEYLKDEGLLTADLKLNSQKTDVYQLLDIVESLNPAADSTNLAEAVADTTALLPSDAPSAAVIEAANPFMVPHGIKVMLTTTIDHAICGKNDFSHLGGKVTVDDGVLVLEEMGFSSKAARMQMTALYRSPRKNHLFVGLDFHLLDIEIADLIDMVPQIDSIVPMLKAFDGQGEFHIAAETNLFANYQPKMSSLKATAAIEGKDLVLMDNATFSEIAKYLMFKKQTENRIDTLSVEMAVARKKATLYPMLIGMDKYQAVISGNHNLTGDMGFNYHISVTDAPLVGGLVGLDIKGDLKHPETISYKVGKCKYANLYKPERRNVTQEQTLQLKELISTSLKRTVR